MANFSVQNPGADVLAAYQKATQLSPISKTDKKKVLSDYGIGVGWAKGQTDAGISMKAADAVVAKFQKDQPKPKPAPVTPTKPTTPKPSTGGAAAPKPVTASLVSSTIAKYGLPGTARPPAYALTNSNELEAWAQRAVRQSLGYGADVSASIAAQVPTILKQFGLPTTSRPPAYALASPAELSAWAQRARRYMLYGY